MPRNLHRRATRFIVATAGGLLLVLQGTALGTQSVTFSWAPNTEANIAGYRIHYGVASRVYTQIVDAGNTTEATIENLVDGTTYYFALGAYNTLGLESGLTGELVYKAPVNLAPLKIRMAAPRQAILTVSGLAGHTYNLQASTDLLNWTTIGTVTAGANGTAIYTDNNPPSRTKRFYRISAAQP